MNRKGLKTFVLIVSLAFGVVAQAFSQIPDEVVLSLRSGNDKTLSSYFNQNIELVIPGHDNVFSKAQAQQIVAGFFEKNQPQRFAVIHQGGKDDSHYAIGNLNTSGGVFRVYFLLKRQGDKSYIHQLRIEKQD